VMCDFSFLAGSIGVAAAERLCRRSNAPRRERLPLFAVPTSGGTRMPRRGRSRSWQMVKISAAVAAHKAAGIRTIVYSAPSDDRRSVRELGLARAGDGCRARRAVGFSSGRAVFGIAVRRALPD